jgi:hypothetical protein
MLSRLHRVALTGTEAPGCGIEVDCADHGFEKAAIVRIRLPTSPQPPVPKPRFILGQESVKRAVTVAAAGGHNTLTLGTSASNRCN